MPRVQGRIGAACAPKTGVPSRSSVGSEGAPKARVPVPGANVGLLRFAVRALACKSGARRAWRARSAGQSLRLRTPCCAWAPAQAFRGLGVRRDERPPDTRLYPAHPRASPRPRDDTR